MLYHKLYPHSVITYAQTYKSNGFLIHQKLNKSTIY